MNKLFKTRVIPTAIHRCGQDYVGEITTRPGVKELRLQAVQYKQYMDIALGFIVCVIAITFVYVKNGEYYD